MNTESSCSLTLYYFQECVFIERLHLCKFIQKADESREPGHIIGSQKEASSVSYSVYTISSFCLGVALQYTPAASSNARLWPAVLLHIMQC